jgi:ketosteroid isomerase-like protein
MAISVALGFIDAINAHDVDQIVALCTPDHEFVDAHGSRIGDGNVRAAWAGYFSLMPRYGIEVEDVLGADATVAVFGWAWGELACVPVGGAAWRRPAAWRARVRQDRMHRWQVYVDTKIVFDLLALHGS